MPEKYPYLGFFWSVFSRIQTEYGEILHISSYSARMWKKTDQKNSEYGHFSHSVSYKSLYNILWNGIALWRKKEWTYLSLL